MAEAKRLHIKMKLMIAKPLVGIFIWSALANTAQGRATYTAHYIDPVIEKAETYLGVHYEYGGSSYSGIDCSGLICESFKSVGIYLPRNSRGQADYWEGEDVYSISELQRGDLIFFRSGYGSGIRHVGQVTSVYGEVTFIHSSSDRGCVAKDKLQGKWKWRFVKGKRLFETITSNGTTQSSPQEYAPSNNHQVPESSSAQTDLSSPQSSAYIEQANSYTMTRLPGKYPEASRRLLTDQDLSKLDKWQLRVMRNEIFARHGYELHINPMVVSYFQGQDWYKHIQPKTRDSSYVYGFRLSEIERKNIRLIQKYEGR